MGLFSRLKSSDDADAKPKDSKSTPKSPHFCKRTIVIIWLDLLLVQLSDDRQIRLCLSTIYCQHAINTKNLPLPEIQILQFLQQDMHTVMNKYVLSLPLQYHVVYWPCVTWQCSSETQDLLSGEWIWCCSPPQHAVAMTHHYSECPH